MFKETDPAKILSTAAGAVFFVGGLSVAVGLITVLFEIRFLEQLGLGWSTIVFGAVFLVLGKYTKQGSIVALSLAILLYAIDGIVFLGLMFQRQGSPAIGSVVFRGVMIWMMARGFGAIRVLKADSKKQPQTYLPGGAVQEHPMAGGMIPTGMPAMRLTDAPAGPPRPISFVAPVQLTAQPQVERPVKSDAGSRSITPEILNLRFVAYRCEITSSQVKAVYQNATQKELKWFEIAAIVIRQLPFQAPWDGKLVLDIVPVVVAGEKIHPVRLLSSTYVNYGVLPQGQSASTKENIRRLASFITSQNRSIFVDPGTDYFVNAGQPPVRFLSMSQFLEYDSRYG